MRDPRLQQNYQDPVQNVKDQIHETNPGIQNEYTDETKAANARDIWGKRRDELAANQRQLADQFGREVPSITSQAYSQIEGDAKNKIAEQQRKISRQAKSRGLLYSGLKTGEQTRAGAQIAGSAAQAKSKVAPELKDLYEDLQNVAAQTAQKNYGDDLNVAKSVYEQALRSARERAASMDDLLEVGGEYAGRYFGGRGAEPEPNYSYEGANDGRYSY